MKIVKVVHAARDQKIELEKQQVTLQSYSVDDFLKKYEESIWGNTSPILLHGIMQSDGDENAIKSALRPVIRYTASKLLQALRDTYEDVAIISLASAKKKYPQTYNLAIGTYALHPCKNDMLTRLEHYHSDLALEKDDELIVLLGKMGAKVIRITESETQDKAVGGQVGVEKMIVNVGFNAGVSQKIEKGRELEVTFEGGNFDVNPDLLKTSLWFSNDSKLQAILQARCFDPSKMKSYALKNTYTETFDFDFDLAVKYLVLKTDLKAEYHSVSQRERNFYVEFGI